MGCGVQTPSPRPLLPVPSLSASSLSRTGAWSLPGALPLGKRAHEGPLSPGHPQTASALPPKEKWLWGSGWLCLDLMSSQRKIRKRGFLSKVKEGVGRLEISAGEGRLLPRVGRALLGWSEDGGAACGCKKLSKCRVTVVGPQPALPLTGLGAGGSFYIGSCRRGWGGWRPAERGLEASARSRALGRQPHSQRAASQLLFFFKSEKGPIWCRLKLASHSQTRCPGVIRAHVPSLLILRWIELTASFPGVPVRRARLCTVLWCSVCRPEADSKEVSLGSPPEGHWREPVASAFAPSPGGGTGSRESGGSAQAKQVKGRVGGALLSVYTRGCQVSPSGHHRFFCGSALSSCCDSLVSPCPLSRATVSPPCGAPTADLLSLTEPSRFLGCFIQ